MRRIFITAAASSSLLAAGVLPATAAAHHHHHAARHHAHKARLVGFGSARVSAAPTTTTPSTETAGKVASFEGGVLKITLADGTTVSGKVTEQTELRCQSATQSGGDDDQGGGDDRAGTAGDEHGGPSVGQFVSQHGDDLRASGQDQNQGSEDQNQGSDDEQSQETCTTAALEKEAVVLGAELKLGGGGAVWEQVVIAH